MIKSILIVIISSIYFNTGWVLAASKQAAIASATLAVVKPAGSGFMPAGTGGILNNEMDDFVSKPRAMNGYSLVGSEVNAIAPGKRMLSSMTPSFLENNKRIAVLGTPGGSRIISMVLLTVLDFVEDQSAKYWLESPRFHHQYLPDQIQYEKGTFSDDEITGLLRLGHSLKEVRYRYGNMQVVEQNKMTGQLSAVSDLRGEGAGWVR